VFSTNIAISSIGPGAALSVRRLETRETNMQPNDGSTRRNSPGRPLAVHEGILIAVLLAVFFLLHILASSVLQRAEAGSVVAEQVSKSRLYD
jgi:hypothetical protein